MHAFSLFFRLRGGVPAEHEGLTDAAALAGELEEPPVVHDAVDDRCGEFVVREDRAPFTELDVRGEYDAPSFVAARDDLVEQARPVDVEGYIHNGAEHTVFASLGDFADFTVTCTAVSKTFNLAGLACSNILISNDTIADRFKAAAERENTSCVPYFARAATIAAYTKAEQWLDELNGVIESNFNLLYSFLRTELPMLNAIRAEGTYLAWIDMRSLGLSDSALEELMLKNYLALDEGYIFGTGGSGFERWNLALPQNELKAALERLKAAVLSLQSKQ